VLSGKERNFNDRFGQLCSHYLFEPTACTPAAGWRRARWRTRSCAAASSSPAEGQSYAELNEMLKERPQSARSHPHPALAGQSVMASLRSREVALDRTATSLRWLCRTPGGGQSKQSGSLRRQPLQRPDAHVCRGIRVVFEGKLIGDRPRHFGRGKTIFDPWHYLPALERKPGALRNGPLALGSAAGLEAHRSD
jgi:hypothetical protein